MPKNLVNQVQTLISSALTLTDLHNKAALVLDTAVSADVPITIDTSKISKTFSTSVINPGNSTYNINILILDPAAAKIAGMPSLKIFPNQNYIIYYDGNNICVLNLNSLEAIIVNPTDNASVTLSPDYFKNTLLLSGAGTKTLAIPAETSILYFPVGYRTTVQMGTSDILNINPGSGVNIIGLTNFSGLNSKLFIEKINTNTWLIYPNFSGFLNRGKLTRTVEELPQTARALTQADNGKIFRMSNGTANLTIANGALDSNFECILDCTILATYVSGGFTNSNLINILPATTGKTRTTNTVNGMSSARVQAGQFAILSVMGGNYRLAVFGQEPQILFGDSSAFLNVQDFRTEQISQATSTQNITIPTETATQFMAEGFTEKFTQGNTGIISLAAQDTNVSIVGPLQTQGIGTTLTLTKKSGGIWNSELTGQQIRSGLLTATSSGAAALAIQLDYVLNGKSVDFRFRRVVATGASAAFINIPAILPDFLRPSIEVRIPISVVDNGGSRSGQCTIRTDGTMQVSSPNSTGAMDFFTVGASMGINATCGSYIL